MYTTSTKTSLLLSIIGFLLIQVKATNVATGLIYQPTFLGEASQPERIPLAPVIYNSNYDYGSQEAIFQSRPCYHGHFTYLGNRCYEQNLAALYGITADFSDTTYLPGSTVTLYLGKSTAPSNSPYTLEQVVAASIQCILISIPHDSLSIDSPLVIRIEGKEKSTPYWVSKYARSYYSLNNNKKSITVPGIRLEKTALCLRYVVFESVYPDPKKNPREPVFIPFLREGECDEGTDESHDISLIPVWHGDKWHERLNVISLPYMPYYEKWSLDPDDPRGLTTESVAIPHLSPPNTSYNIENLHVSRSDKGVTVTIFNYNNDRDFCPSKLASMIYSCIVSERPTLDRPMTVVIPGDSLPVKYRMRLKADTSWKNGNSCEFAFDPTRLKLLKGNLPGYALKNNDGQLVVSILENENISDEKIIELVDDSDISMSSDMGLILFEKEKSVKFPFGYKIYDFQGNIIKSVSSDTGLIVRGKKLINTSSGKITAYLTTWGYKRYMEGKHLQWAVGLDSYEIK